MHVDQGQHSSQLLYCCLFAEHRSFNPFPRVWPWSEPNITSTSTPSAPGQPLPSLTKNISKKTPLIFRSASIPSPWRVSGIQRIWSGRPYFWPPMHPILSPARPCWWMGGQPSGKAIQQHRLGECHSSKIFGFLNALTRDQVREENLME